ncbi:hypothetical protein JCM10213_001586 [Rhodosporidiobolus nylandii]
MDRLEQLVNDQDWAGALSLAQSTQVDVPPPTLAFLVQQHLLTLLPSPSSSATLPEAAATEALDATFPLLAADHAPWLAAFLLRLSRLASSPALAAKASELGLKAVDRWIASPALQVLSDAVGEKDWVRVDELVREEGGEAHRAVRARRAFLDGQDRVLSWEAIWGSSGGTVADDGSVRGGEEKDEAEEDDEGWGDDLALPASDAGSSPPSRPSSPSPPGAAAPAPEAEETPPRPSLPTFLSRPLSSTALALAASASLPELALLCTLHAPALWPIRVALLEAIPEWVEPSEYLTLLPRVDAAGREGEWEDVQPWRAEADWCEALPSLSASSSAAGQEQEGGKRTAEQLEQWYLSRVERLADLGLVQPALAMVQHAAARGVMGLDSVGEELSLLSRLVYDRPSTPAEGEGAEEHEGEELTLSYWRSLSPSEVVRAYTARCTAANLATTLRRLVLPYLSVLESRLEREGAPDAGGAAERLLYEYLLSLPSARGRRDGMDLLLAVFEASKPTLPSGARIVKNDADLARLALACLYGFGGGDAGGRPPSEGEVVAMGRIFECLPAFDVASSSSSPAAGEEVNLFALPASCLTPSALFASLAPASPARLSTLLDTLDLHLSQLEAFLRYSCPTSLAWFLSSSSSRTAQLAWATRLARTAATGGAGAWRAANAGAEGEFESEDEWVGLMEFMAEATGTAGDPAEDEGERRRKGLGRAFAELGREEVLRIFFGGLLGAGRFSLARSLFEPSSTSPPLEPGVVEELVIAASREFYDNAEEGNLHKGEMKMAFDCLSAAPQQTPSIRRERSFIEATSRLCSFRLLSPSTGLPLIPHELRHSPDKLGIVSCLLSTSDDAHRHPEMILELVRKLGYPAGGKAEVRTLAMLAEAAMLGEDFERAKEMCDRAASVVETMRRQRGKRAEGKEGWEDDQDAEAAAAYAWPACFQLGKHDAWDDLERRKDVVGQALVLCPPQRIAALLPVWTELEKEVAVQAARRAKENAEGGSKKTGPGLGEQAVDGAAKMANFLAAAARDAASAAQPPSPLPSAASHPRPDTPQTSAARDLAAEAAEAASRTLRSAAAFLPSFGHASAGGSRPSSAQSHNRPQTPTSAASATGAFPPGAFSVAPSSPAKAASSAAAAKPALKGKAKLGARRAAPSSVSPAPPSPARSPSPPPPQQPHPPSSPPSRFASAFDSPPSRFASAFNGVGSSSPPPQQLPPHSRAGAADQGGFSGFGLRAGLSNKLTAGVGWLIGADEMMEEQARERERERAFGEQSRRRARQETPERSASRVVGSKEEEDASWGW